MLTKTAAKPVQGSPERTVRATAHRVLETAGGKDRLSHIVDLCLITLIGLSVAAVIVESVPGIAERYAASLYRFEVFTVLVFTVEYSLRLWSCVENPEYRRMGAAKGRLRFAFSFHAIVDLLAILPFYLITFGLFAGADMRFLRAFRLLRVLKLTRYSSALNLLIVTIHDNARALAASFLILLTVMLLAASGMYYFERGAQPVAFGSIPAAMWWAFATLTTVG
ncbi:MAG: ion transporter [Pseudomonadota bacterium]